MKIADAMKIIDAKDHLISVLERELASVRADCDLVRRENFLLRTTLDEYKYLSGKRRYYSPDDLSTMLNISKNTVLAYLKKGLIKHTRIVDPEGQRATYRISESDFADFISSCSPKLFEQAEVREENN